MSDADDLITLTEREKVVPKERLLALLGGHSATDSGMLTRLFATCRALGPAVERELVATLRESLEAYLARLGAFTPGFPGDVLQWFSVEAICSALTEARADVAFAEPLAIAATELPASSAFLRALVRMLWKREPDAAVRVYTRVLDRAKERPSLAFAPSYDMPELVAHAPGPMAELLVAHLPELRERNNVWLVGDVAKSLLSSAATDAVTTALLQAAETWSHDTLEGFASAITHMTFYSEDAQRNRDAILRVVFPALIARHGKGWIRAAKTKRLLAKLGLTKNAPVASLPAKVPLDVADALELLRSYGVNRGALTKKSPAASTAIEGIEADLGELPSDLRALYAFSDGCGPIVMPLDKLAANRAKMEKLARDHERDADEEVTEPGDLDVRRFVPFERLWVLGKDDNGDLLFIDPAARTKEGSTPVLRFVHDESCTVRPEAASVGALLSLLILELWSVREGEESAFWNLKRNERERAMPV